MKELDRVLSLHYSDDMEVIRKCCYAEDGEPPTVRNRISEIELRGRAERELAEQGVHGCARAHQK